MDLSIEPSSVSMSIEHMQYHAGIDDDNEQFVRLHKPTYYPFIRCSRWAHIRRVMVLVRGVCVCGRAMYVRARTNSSQATDSSPMIDFNRLLLTAMSQPIGYGKCKWWTRRGRCARIYCIPRNDNKINYQINTILYRLSSHRIASYRIVSHVTDHRSNQWPTHAYIAGAQHFVCQLIKLQLIYRRLSKSASKWVRTSTVSRFQENNRISASSPLIAGSIHWALIVPMGEISLNYVWYGECGAKNKVQNEWADRRRRTCAVCIRFRCIIYISCFTNRRWLDNLRQRKRKKENKKNQIQEQDK